MTVRPGPRGKPQVCLQLEFPIVQLQSRMVLGVVVLACLSMAGCGKKEIDPERRAQSQVAKNKDGDWNANRLKLKMLAQEKPNSSEARFRLGVAMLTDGEASAAIAEFQRALELKHAEGQVLPYLADAMNQTGQSHSVITKFAGRQLDDPEANAGLAATVASAYASQGNPLMARKTIDAALATAPKSARVLLVNARLLIADSKPKQALAVIDELLVVHPQDHEAWAVKGDLLMRESATQDQALAAYAKASEIKPDFPYALSSSLSLHLKRGEIDAAKANLAQLQKVAPKHVNTGMSEAAIAFAAGDYNTARDTYQALLRVLPEDVNLLLSAGENDLRRDAPQQAEAHFAKASSLAPRDSRARRLLAEAQLKLGQPARALVTLAPLVDPAEAPAEALALAAEARLLNGEAQEADALFKRIAKLKPDDPQLRTVIARARLGKSNDEAAYQELRSIAETDKGTTADLTLIAAHLQHNQFDQALSAVDVLIKKRPNEPMGQNLRGKVLMGKGDKPAARAAFEAALTKNPAFYPAVASLASLDLQEGKFDDARKRFAELIKRQPANVSARLGMAELLSRTDAPRAEVRAQLESAVTEVPNDVDARVALVSFHAGANNTEAALSAAQSATAVIIDNIELLELLGNSQIRARQTAQALATFGRMVSLQPKSPRGHLGTVDAYLAADQVDLAEKSVARALELAPRNVDVIGHAVAVATRKRQFPAAIDYARRIQADRPGESLGFLLEGEIEMARSNWSNAVVALRKGLERPLPGGASAKLVHALIRSGRQPEADAFAKEWLEKHPRDSSLLFYLADAAQRRGDMATAEKRYGDVLALNNGHALALNNLAVLKLRQQQPGALDLAQRAVQAMPDQPPLLDTLAQAYAADKQLPKAIETQQRATVLAPMDGALRLSLARYQLAAGNKAQAKSELDRLAKLGSAFDGHQQVQDLLSELGSRTLSR